MLLKPDQLNCEESRIMEAHVQKGISVLGRLFGEFGFTDLADSAMIVLFAPRA